MKRLIQRAWSEDEGVLSFEWILLITLLVIGLVAGLAAVRDATIDELGDVAEAAINIDQSYTMPGDEDLGLEEVVFEDELPGFATCDRGGPAGQNAPN